MSLKKILSAVALIGTLSLGVEAQVVVAGKIVGPANQYLLGVEQREGTALRIRNGTPLAPTVLHLSSSAHRFRLPPFAATFLVPQVSSGPFWLDEDGSMDIRFPAHQMGASETIYVQSVSLAGNGLEASNMLQITTTGADFRSLDKS